MARAFPRLLLSILAIAAACGGADDDATAGGRDDTARQADAATAVRDTAQARQEVLRLSEELLRAFVRGDSAPASRLLAEDYAGVTMDGHPETRADVLANVRRDRTNAAAPTADSLQLDRTTARVYGDAAVAQASGTFRMRAGGEAGTLHFRNTDVFVWRDGRWQIVATHLSRVDAPRGR